MMSARLLAAILAVGLLAVLAGCGSGAKLPPSSATTFPDTPAGKQARWFVTTVAHHPVSAQQIESHFDSGLLATVPAPAVQTLNASWQGIRSLRLERMTGATNDQVEFVVISNGASRMSVTLAVDSRGLISRIHLQPAGGASPPPAPVTASPSAATAGIRQLPVGVGTPPLTGTLTLPAGKGPFPAVVLVSGSGPSDQNESVGPNKPFLDIALGLAARGIASLRYDKRTRDYPQSIDPKTATIAQEYVPDALAAITLLKHKDAIDPHLIFVLGHSQGGTYAPLIAKRAPDLAGVIMLAPGIEPLGAAMLRQVQYLASLPGEVGAQARTQLPEVSRLAALIDDPSALKRLSPGTDIVGGAGPAYFLSGLHYDPLQTARTIPQPPLFLQGERDYQVTVKDDLRVWVQGLAGRKGVTVVKLPKADHLFLDGTGAPSPDDYARAGHVDPRVTATITSWIGRVERTIRSTRSARPPE
jgi:pimeloyl-ACP methyl ester carboxylesterase